MIFDKVRNTIKRYHLISSGDKIIVAVSGGPDSVALLYLLNNLSKELDIRLHVAHLDHGLRQGSCRDREFAEKLAKDFGLPVTTARVNLKALAKGRGSIEEIARNARLGFLFGVARKIKTRKIALGHNLDDQAETVLMRILRGSGLYGLVGILPKRAISGYQIIRPLIGISRREIETFLKQKKIKFVVDKSNLEDIYFRNRIRHKLLPLLAKEYNPKIKQILAGMSESIGYDYDYLRQEVELKMRCLGKKINLKKFLKLHPAIQRSLLRLGFARLKGDTRRLTFQHLREIEDLILNRPVNSIVDLPKGISVKKTPKSIYFYQRQYPQ